MSSNSVIISTTNDQLSSTNNNFYSSSPNLSSSSSSCSSNTTPINKINSNSSLNSNHRKDSTLKLPYPVLSDHRDPSSIIILLQKETQTTSKKIANVIKKIDECEQNLTLNIYTDNDKKLFKIKRVKFKQQLDALKKHERRVSLQIDFITIKSEIKGLEDEQKSNENQQIKILLGKLKQKLDKMKVYMRTRNEQMKKIINGKQHRNDKRKLSSQKHSTSEKDFNSKRSLTLTNHSHLNKRFKSTTPMIRLTSRVTSHDSNKHTTQQPIVRFIDKTTNVKINSASPTTPASSSSTLSPQLIENTNKKSQSQVSIDSDDELDLELDMDELFNDDSYSEQTVQRLKK